MGILYLIFEEPFVKYNLYVELNELFAYMMLSISIMLILTFSNSLNKNNFLIASSLLLT